MTGARRERSARTKFYAFAAAAALKQFAGGGCSNAWLGSRVEFTVRSTATDAIRTIYYGGMDRAQGSIVFDSAVTWPCQVVGFETSPGDGDASTLETIIRLNTSCAGPKTPPTPTQGPFPAVPAPAPMMPESSPTTRPVTPDEPLGLSEDSATAAPTAESDGPLGPRVAWAACVLAALLL